MKNEGLTLIYAQKKVLDNNKPGVGVRGSYKNYQ